MKFPISNVVQSHCVFVIEVFPVSLMLNCYIATSHCPGKKHLILYDSFDNLIFRKLSSEELVVDELRTGIRFLVAKILRRVKQVS